MGTALTLTDQRTMAQQFAMSKLFATRGPAEMFVKIQAGQELGIAPFAAISAIHVINNKPVLSATLQAALIRKSADYDYHVNELSETRCDLTITRKGKEVGRSVFTLKDAKDAGLSDGPNKATWKKYPRNMLFSRAISNALRWYCPDLGAGTTWYAPEEIDTVETPTVLDAEVTGTDLGQEKEVRLSTIQGLIKNTGASEMSILTYYGVTDLAQLVTDDDNYHDAISKLQSKAKVTDADQTERGVLQGNGPEVGDRDGGQGPGQAVLDADV
jgi:hypothetical protein